MGGDNPEFVVQVEFICLLNMFKPAAPFPESIKRPVFVVRGQIALKGEHGIDRIDVISKGPKESVINNTLPGPVG